MSTKFTTDFIGLPSFQLAYWEKTTETDWVVTLTPNPATHLCPLCRKASINHTRQKHRLLRHRFIPSWGTVWVRVPVYRQRCNDCQITWTIEWEGIPYRGTATCAFRQMAVELCQKRDLLSVSKQLGIPYTTLERWYYQLAPQLLAQPQDHLAPAIVCLDEFALQKGHKLLQTWLLEWQRPFEAFGRRQG